MANLDIDLEAITEKLLSDGITAFTRSPIVEAEHLAAALAVWRYCEDSARYIFGDQLGDPVADGILAALRESSEGLTRTEISNLCGRHKSAAQIAAALAVLQERGLISFRREQTAGRSVEVWFAVTGGAKEAN